MPYYCPICGGPMYAYPGTCKCCCAECGHMMCVGTPVCSPKYLPTPRQISAINTINMRYGCTYQPQTRQAAWAIINRYYR